MLAPIGSGPSQPQPPRFGADDVGNGVEDGPQLRLPVALALDGLGVKADRDVVDKHPAVDFGEIDPPDATTGERIESTDNIVAVNSQVEREMVARPGRNASVREAMLGSEHGHHRLGAIPTGHRQRIGSLVDRFTHQLLEVDSALQFDRLDSTRPSLVGQVKSLGLPPARLRVVEEDGVSWVGRLAKRGVGPECRPGGNEHRRQARHDHDGQPEAIALGEQNGDRECQGEDRDSGSHHPGRSGSGQAVPGCRNRNPEAGQNSAAEEEPRNDDVGNEDEENRGGSKGGERGETIDLLEPHHQTIRRDGRFARDPRS